MNNVYFCGIIPKVDDDYYRYKDLANAIILKACQDFRCGNMSEEDFIKFCRSEWYAVLTNLDGEILIERLVKEKRLNEKKHSRRYVQK